MHIPVYLGIQCHEMVFCTRVFSGPMLKRLMLFSSTWSLGVLNIQINFSHIIIIITVITNVTYYGTNSNKMQQMHYPVLTMLTLYIIIGSLRNYLQSKVS